MKTSTAVGLMLSMLTVASMAYVNVQAREIEPEPTPYVDNYAEINCLALNVYFEARGESEVGQRAVAWVTLNRVADPNYPDTICDTVWEPGQFSWTEDGKSDKPKDMYAYATALYIAYDVLTEYHHADDPTEGAVMYHSTKVKPYWKAKYKKVNRIDNHIFYKEVDSGQGKG